jgi:hypothetical protein
MFFDGGKQVAGAAIVQEKYTLSNTPKWRCAWSRVAWQARTELE